MKNCSRNPPSTKKTHHENLPTSFVVVKTITHEVWLITKLNDEIDGILTNLAIVVSLEDLPKYDLEHVRWRVFTAAKEQLGGNISDFRIHSQLFRSPNAELAGMIAYMWNKYEPEVTG